MLPYGHQSQSRSLTPLDPLPGQRPDPRHRAPTVDHPHQARQRDAQRSVGSSTLVITLSRFFRSSPLLVAGIPEEINPLPAHAGMPIDVFFTES